MKKLSLILFLSFLISNNCYAASSHHHSIHAPIGVTRDHTHNKGEVMISFRNSRMFMDGLIQGNDNKTKSDILQNYMATPTKMTTQMYMLGVMYGLSDKLTLSIMSGFISKDMDHQRRNGEEFNREASGLSDTKLNAMYRIFANDNNDTIQINFGLSTPTGSIHEKHGNDRLPYPMQLGSGSYELLPGISSTFKIAKDMKLGAQINTTFRLDSNKYGYKLGDNYNFTSWVDKRITHDVAISTRLDYNINEAIEGADATLNPNMIPTADGSLFDSQRLDILFGVSLINGFGIEFGVPLYQRIQGPALENKYRLTIGWQKSF